MQLVRLTKADGNRGPIAITPDHLELTPAEDGGTWVQHGSEPHFRVAEDFDAAIALVNAALS